MCWQAAGRLAGQDATGVPPGHYGRFSLENRLFHRVVARGQQESVPFWQGVWLAERNPFESWGGERLPIALRAGVGGQRSHGWRNADDSE